MKAQSRVSRRLFVAAGGMLLGLGGCSSVIGPPEPPRIYRLQPVLPAGSPGAPVKWQLAVARPEALHTLDSERIALSRGAAMDYYADAQWNDTAPRLLLSLLVEAFEKSGRIGAVAPESSGLRADYVLATDIRDFEAQYESETSPPVVHIDIEAKLVDTRGIVLATLDAHRQTAAAQNSVPAVVAAFDSALGSVLGQVVDWTFRSAPGERALGDRS